MKINEITYILVSDVRNEILFIIYTLRVFLIPTEINLVFFDICVLFLISHGSSRERTNFFFREQS